MPPSAQTFSGSNGSSSGSVSNGSATASPAFFASSSSTLVADTSDALQRIGALYSRAIRAFLVRQLPLCWTLCMDAMRDLRAVHSDKLPKLARIHSSTGNAKVAVGEVIEVANRLRQRLWILYVTVIGGLMEVASLADTNNSNNNSNGSNKATGKRLSGAKDEIVLRRNCGIDCSTLSAHATFPSSLTEIWTSIVHDFGDVQGAVDSEVIVTCVLLCIREKQLALARQMVEGWISTLPDRTLDAISVDLHRHYQQQQQQHQQTTKADARSTDTSNLTPYQLYARVVELYTLHILCGLKDWAGARSFLEYNTIIPEATKAAYMDAINRLQRRAKAPKKAPAQSRQQPQQQQHQHQHQQALSSQTSSAEDKPANGHSTPVGILGENGIPISNGATLRKSEQSTFATAANISAVARSTSPKVEQTSSITVHQPRNSTDSASSQTSDNPLVALWRQLTHFIQQIKAGRHRGTMFIITLVLAVVAILKMRRMTLRAALTLAGSKIIQTVQMGTRITSL
ncbi:hypothetical protein GQ42DRAFT_165754 [Ramicandelaber brevisporus]|nr:hypothetical protein GQ42DRAFT_165754 [Ramicandelaber brevisporus]